MADPSPLLPFTEAGRLVGARLCQFGSGSAQLLGAHKDWVTKYFVPKMKQNPNAWIDFIGSASPVGSKEGNIELSSRRIASVEGFIKSLYPGIKVNVRLPEGASDAASFHTPTNNDDGYWRAVLIRWYGVPLAGEDVPRYPPEPAPPPAGPHRSRMKWAVSGVGALQNNPWSWLPAQIALNFFWFKDKETSEIGWFISPMCGAGIDLLGTLRGVVAKLKEEANFLKTMASIEKAMTVEKFLAGIARGDLKGAMKALADMIITGTSFSPTPGDFSDAEVYLPLTLNKLDGSNIGTASVTVTVKQYGTVFVNGQTFYYGKDGLRRFGMRDYLSVPPSWSTQIQIPNIGASFIGGPLIRLK